MLELAFRLSEGWLGIDHARLRRGREFLRAGRLADYTPHPYTVFSRPVPSAELNQHGFRDKPWSLAREPGEWRILCLGASTTESGNALGRQGSYPFLLEELLGSRTDRPCRVMNAAVAGWTTAEMLTSWFLQLRDFAPDVLIVHDAISDLPPRFLADFRADYSHWRRPLTLTAASWPVRQLARSDAFVWTWLAMRGVPDIGALTTRALEPEQRSPDDRLSQETARPFVRNLECITRDARSSGARVVIMTMPARSGDGAPEMRAWVEGLAEHNELLRVLAREHGYELVDAARVFEARGAELAGEFLDFVHLSRAGNLAKAELLAEQLLPGPTPGAATEPGSLAR